MATLNVLLHGLFLFVDREDYLLALAPDLSGQHVYRAGNFLGCTELHRGMYRLAGVDPGGDATFNPDLNFILKDKVLKPDAVHLAHATIWFRRPKQILSVRPVVFNPDEFTGSDKNLVSKFAATTQILVYSCPSLASVRLVGHPWLPPQTPGDGPFNLHIYSEEDTRVRLLKHPENAIGALAGLFQNLEIQLSDDNAMSKLANLQEQLPPAVMGQELEPLSHTQSRLSDQGLSMKSLLAGNPELFQAIWSGDEPRPLGARTGSCSSAILLESV